MYNKNHSISPRKDPLYVRNPEAFEQPRTIPTGWDVSEMLAQDWQDQEDGSSLPDESGEADAR
jgi:hypothetical protein